MPFISNNSETENLFDKKRAWMNQATLIYLVILFFILFIPVDMGKLYGKEIPLALILRAGQAAGLMLLIRHSSATRQIRIVFVRSIGYVVLVPGLYIFFFSPTALISNMAGGDTFFISIAVGLFFLSVSFLLIFSRRVPRVSLEPLFIIPHRRPQATRPLPFVRKPGIALLLFGSGVLGPLLILACPIKSIVGFEHAFEPNYTNAIFDLFPNSRHGILGIDYIFNTAGMNIPYRYLLLLEVFCISSCACLYLFNFAWCHIRTIRIYNTILTVAIFLVSVKGGLAISFGELIALILALCSTYITFRPSLLWGGSRQVAPAPSAVVR
jgi:hypothetical protein